jgi:hypothetical protein
MIEKKLLTVAGVAGILACGACFLPPLPHKKAPLPPALASVHRITIQVEDGTTGNLFDPLIMSNATASNFNELWRDFPVRADAVNAGESSDAALRITVHRKTVSCKAESKDNLFCSYEMIISVTLTAADGTILKSRQQESSKFGLWYHGDSLKENLNANPFRQQASYSLATTAGEILFY